jgi:hypothetical protein
MRPQHNIAKIYFTPHCDFFQVSLMGTRNEVTEGLFPISIFYNEQIHRFSCNIFSPTSTPFITKVLKNVKIS